jgi:hypothetical protein
MKSKRSMQALFLALVAVVGISVPIKPSMRAFHRIFNWHTGFNLRCFAVTSNIAGKLTHLLHSKEMKR